MIEDLGGLIAFVCDLRFCVTIRAMEYTSGDLSARLGVTSETLRVWSGEFRRWLSPGTNPTGGKKRRFTFADLEVLQLVADMREKNADWDEIHATLENGERGTPSIDPAALVPLESQKQIALLYETIERLRTANADLEARLAAERTRADRAEGVQDNLMRQIAELRESEVQLRIKVAALEKNMD